MADTYETLVTIERALAQELTPGEGEVTVALPPDIERYIIESYQRSVHAIQRAIVDCNVELLHTAPLTALTVAFYTGYRAGRGDTIIDPPKRIGR